MFLVGTALLTSTLSTAKEAFHEEMLRKGQAAMTSATADFISWSQGNVHASGIGVVPTWAERVYKYPLRPICSSGRILQPSKTDQGQCNFSESVTWDVTGYAQAKQELSAQATSEATNLALAQDEGRLSATINVTITNASGSQVFSKESRQVTARVFISPPYIALTGVRDISSQLRAIGPAEGDTAGFSRQEEASNSPVVPPTVSKPGDYTKTTLLTTIDCLNSPGNGLSDPLLDDNQVAFVGVRPYGNLAWAYEMPCRSSVPINPSTAPVGYVQPTNGVYGTTLTQSHLWNKNDENRSSFAF